MYHCMNSHIGSIREIRIFCRIGMIACQSERLFECSFTVIDQGCPYCRIVLHHISHCANGCNKAYYSHKNNDQSFFPHCFHTSYILVERLNLTLSYNKRNSKMMQLFLLKVIF